MNYQIDAMHCDGCARGVRAAVAEADPAASLTVDLTRRRVSIDSRREAEVLAALDAAGFPAVPVTA